VSDSARRLRWPLEVTTECADDALIVTLRGRISARSAPRLAAHLESPEFRGFRHVIIDISGVDYVSSAGLLAVDLAAERAGRQGGTVILAGIQEPVRTALDLAGLLPKLATEPTREAALARVRANPHDLRH
jgi:stage II sporulation protein AA (anti-sigma F factor antagonist)